MVTSKRLAKLAPAAGVAFARLLLNGVPQYGGGGCGSAQVCCWCEEYHSGHHVLAGLARGCFRPTLRAIKAFAFLVDAPPDIWYLLTLQVSRGDADSIRQLAKLSIVLV
eukprot:440093-Amphidinium_carterae.1